MSKNSPGVSAITLNNESLAKDKIYEHSDECLDDSYNPNQEMSIYEKIKQIDESLSEPTGSAASALNLHGTLTSHINEEPRRTNDKGKKEHKQRNALDLNFINSHLGGKEMFSKLGSDPNHPIKVTDQLVSGCIKAFKHRIYEKGENIIEYGNYGDEYYILMRGVADVYVPIKENMTFTPDEASEFRKKSPNQILFMKLKPPNPLVLKTKTFAVEKREYKVKSLIFTDRLTAGSGFGELALIYDKPRAASVTSAGVCHVAYLNKVDFNEILSETIREEKHERVKAIKSIPLLSKLEGAILLKVPFCVKSRTFTSGEVVYDEGDPADKIYFIEKGEFQRHRNGTLDFYGIKNPDLNSKYKISYKGIPTEFTAMKSNYTGELPKTKEITKEHSKIAIITEGRAFGVTEVLQEMSTRILSVKCCSETAFCYYIAKLDFNYYLKKHLEEKSLMQCLLERTNLVEKSMNDILLTKKNAKKMGDATRKRISIKRTKKLKNISVNQTSRNIDESAISLKAQDFFPNSNIKNMNSKYSGQLSHKIPFNLLKSRNLTNLTTSNTSPTTTQNNIQSPIHGRLEPMKSKAGEDEGSKRGRWSNLGHKLTLPILSKNNERILSPPESPKGSKILANYMSIANKPKASITSRTDLSRKYDLLLEEMKSEDLSYITNKNMILKEPQIRKNTRLNNCQSCQLYKERNLSRNNQLHSNIHTYRPRGGINIKGKGDEKLKHNRNELCTEISKTLDDLLPVVNKSSKSPTSQNKLYATRHHLFRLLNLSK